MNECEACCGVLGFMGMLGRRAWYRCLNCGLDSSSLEVEHDEDDDGADGGDGHGAG